MPYLNLYQGREQTYVKHWILEEYLEKFAFIIGSAWDTITYIDCFSGPWQSRDPQYADTSFGIALRKLRAARDGLANNRQRRISLRCMFLEKNRSSFARLRGYVKSIPDVATNPKNKELEAAIPDILDFIRQGGPKNFTFIFIDPTGWSGFSLDVIAPLLQNTPGEVLINFMTDYIRRFAESEDPDIRASFRRTFGQDVHDALRGLTSQEREEKLLHLYMHNVKKAGSFVYVGAAIILKPEIEKTFFHLIYATRHPKGIEVFKKVEQDAMEATETIRASARERKTGQTSFFVPGSPLLHDLRSRYVAQAKERARRRLRQDGRAKYVDLWRRALAFPLVWESDVWQWLTEWPVKVEGLSERQKPKWHRDIEVLWRG